MNRATIGFLGFVAAMIMVTLTLTMVRYDRTLPATDTISVVVPVTGQERPPDAPCNPVRRVRTTGLGPPHDWEPETVCWQGI